MFRNPLLRVSVTAVVLCTLLLTGVAFGGALVIVHSGAARFRGPDEWYGISPFTVLIVCCGVLLFSVLIWFFYRLTDRLNGRQLSVCGCVLFAVLALLLSLTVWCFPVIPNSDSYMVQDQAAALALGIDEKIDTSVPYFSRYSNNTFLILLLAVFYKILSFFGVENFSAASVLCNTLLLYVAEILLFLSVKKLFGDRFAVRFLVLNMLNPVLYLTAPWVYSVSFCMPFMTGVFYCGVCIYKQKQFKRRIFASVLFGVLSAAGFLIRPVVLIESIAFGVCFLVFFLARKNKKQLWRQLVCAGLCVVVTAGGYLALRPAVQHYANDTSGNYPLTHWIMMGLHGNGSFNSADSSFTASFETKAEKTAANLQEIKETLQDYGVTGTIGHLIVKHCVTWSEGSADAALRLKQQNRYTGIYPYVAGDKADGLLLYCQIYRAAVLLFCCVGIVTMLRKREKQFLLPVVTLFGAMLFYLIWEAKQSYSIPFLFVICLLAARGFSSLPSARQTAGKRPPVLHIIMPVCLALSVVFLVGKAGALYRQDWTFEQPAVCCDNPNNLLKHKDLAVGGHVLCQEFYADRPVNQLALYADQLSGDAVYIVTLSNADGDRIGQWTVGKNDSKDRWITLTLPENLEPAGREKYRLFIRAADGQTEDSIAWIQTFSKVLDTYAGELSIGGQTVNGDLVLNVYQSKTGPFTTPGIYWCVGAAVLLLELGLYGGCILLVSRGRSVS